MENVIYGNQTNLKDLDKYYSHHEKCFNCGYEFIILILKGLTRRVVFVKCPNCENEVKRTWLNL